MSSFLPPITTPNNARNEVKLSGRRLERTKSIITEINEFHALIK